MRSAKSLLHGGLIALLLFGQSSLGHIPGTRTKPSIEEKVRSEKNLFAAEKPHIYGMRIHHLHDENKDGQYLTTEGLTRVYLETSKNRIEIKELIPGEGSLGVYVPQQGYWGSRIIAKLIDTTNGKNYILDERVVFDIRNVNETNSYASKPQECALIPLEDFRKQLEKIHSPAKPGIHDYHLIIMREDGFHCHSAIFRVDYSRPYKGLEAKKEE